MFCWMGTRFIGSVKNSSTYEKQWLTRGWKSCLQQEVSQSFINSFVAGDSDRSRHRGQWHFELPVNRYIILVSDKYLVLVLIWGLTRADVSSSVYNILINPLRMQVPEIRLCKLARTYNSAAQFLIIRNKPVPSMFYTYIYSAVLPPRHNRHQS